ncbi:MAG TPA: hypothetical protein VF765_10320 [Polyangiaceae bacterium]
MRTIALCSVGALLLGASALGCYDEPEQHPARSTAVVTQPVMAPPVGGSVTVVHRDDQRGVASTQAPAQPGATQAQPNTPVINNFVTAPPSSTQDQSAQSSSLPTQPPPLAATPTDDRARASQIVAEATQQIDRLTRVLSMSAKDARHTEIEAAVGQLESKREHVLKDIKTLETTGASSSDDTQHIILNRDVSDLQLALQKSYEYAPPSTQ